MKAVIATLLLVSLAAAFPHVPAPANAPAKPPAAAAAAAALPRNFLGTFIPQAGNPYGAQAYGLGLNNLFAEGHDVYEAQRYLSLAKQRPNILVRFDHDGDITLTDRNGFEVEHIGDQFGRNLLDLYDL